MASTKQVTLITEFGFTQDYAESLPSNHAHRLISQLHRISHVYYGSNLTRMSADVKDAVSRIDQSQVAESVADLAEVAK